MTADERRAYMRAYMRRYRQAHLEELRAYQRQSERDKRRVAAFMAERTVSKV
jgi:hypothetical protein